MNNWRLLLLALVAVFQPIASFTESNLVDGRQQCCDRQTDTLLQDSRPLYGNQRLAKVSSPLRRLNNRDEIREDRHELRQRDTVFSRRSTERSLQDSRERDTRQSPSFLARSTRVEYRPERIAIDDNREHRLDVQRRDRNAGNTQDLKSEDQNRSNRVLERRDSMMRHNDRTNELSSRHIISRDNNRISRFTNERQTRNSDSQRNRMQTRSGDLRRLTPTRETRGNLRQAREEVVRSVDVSNGNRRHIAREWANVVRRETASRDDVRRVLDGNNERREQEHYAEQRRSLSENSRVAERVRDMRVRVNSRDDRRENRDTTVSSNRQLMTERLEQRQQRSDLRQSREQRENIERTLSRERMQMDQRDVRVSRLTIDMDNRRNRASYSRRDTRYSERRSIETRDFAQQRRDESRPSRKVHSLERDNRVTDRRARSVDIRNSRDIRAASKFSQFAEVVREQPPTHRQVDYRNKIETRERYNIDNRLRNVDYARTRDMMDNKIETESEATSNWQFIFYTLQAAYLCGLLMQILTPKRSEKSKMMNLRWWPLSSQRNTKVD